MCLLAGCLWIDDASHSERIERSAIGATVLSVDPEVWSSCGAAAASFTVAFEVASAHAGEIFDVWLEADGGERTMLPPARAVSTTLTLEVAIATGDLSCSGLCAVPLTIGLERLGVTEQHRVDVTLVADGPPAIAGVYVFDVAGVGSLLEETSTQDSPPGSISVADWPELGILVNDGYTSIGEGGLTSVALCPAGVDPAVDRSSCTLLPTTVEPPVGGDWLHRVATAAFGPPGCAAAFAGGDLVLHAVIDDHACGGPYSYALNDGAPLLVDPDCDGDGVAPPADCDDLDAAIAPGLAETWYDGVDTDCGGGSDLDQDGDGVDALAYGGGDCDDTDADRSPYALEICDGKDNDCDDVIAVDQATLTSAGSVSNYSSVHAAIDAATDGDTVAVCDGTYDGPFVIDDSIMFVSGSRAPDRTTLLGGAPGESVLRIGDPGDALDVTVAGFTIMGGGGASDGGGIDGRGAATLELEDLVVDGNDAARGGGLALSGNVFLTRVDVQDNTAIDGGGIVAASGTVLTLEETTVSDNIAAANGGGLCVVGSLTITGGAIVGNETQAEDGGGLYAEGAGAVIDLTGVTFEGNDADGDGGAIAARSTGSTPIAITLDDLHVTGNEAVLGGGLALVFAALETGEVELAANSAVSGGAIHADDASVVDLGVLGGVTSVVGNEAAGSGGGVHLEEATSVLFGTNVLFDSNSAEDGGAVDTNGGDVDLTGGALTANMADDDGGAIHVDSGATVFLRGAIFADGNTGGGAEQAGFVTDGLLAVCVGTQMNDPVANFIGGAAIAEECFEVTPSDVTFTCDSC